MENLKSGILACMPRDRNRFDFPGDPAGDSFSDAHRDLSDQSRMRVFRGAQHEVIACLVQQVNETGITVCHVDDQFDDLSQNLIEIQSGADGLADLMQNAQFLARQVQRLLDGFDGINITSHYYRFVSERLSSARPSLEL